MRLLGTILAVVALSGAACFSPNIQDGQIECSPEGDCPPGFTCGDDNRCHGESGGATDAAPATDAALGEGDDGGGQDGPPATGDDGGAVDAPAGDDGGGMGDADAGPETDGAPGSADAGPGVDAGPPLSAPPTIFQCTSGGGVSTSATYDLTFSVGQPIVGTSVGGGRQVTWGLLPMSGVP